MKEIWKNISGYEGIYQVSNFGRIKSLKHKTLRKNIFGKNKSAYYIYDEKILNGWIENNGYLMISLKNKKYLIHRIVAKTFIKNPKNYPIINHIDGNKLNNCVDNLEWCTYKHNFNEAVKLGLIKPKYNSNDNRIRAKKIAQYSLDNKLIKIHACSVDAEKELKSKGVKINARNIRKVCLNERKTAGGFIWKYI